jgi:hypothetical protein
VDTGEGRRGEEEKRRGGEEEKRDIPVSRVNVSPLLPLLLFSSSLPLPVS